MAATDQTYRNQRTLDIVFGASCVLMLAGIVWMFAQDYYRDYKVEARDFRDVEAALYERQMLDLVPDAERMKAIEVAEKNLAAERDSHDKQARGLQKQIDQILPAKVRSEANAQRIKADYDSKVSLYNIAVEKRNAAPEGSAERKNLDARAAAVLQKVDQLREQLASAQAEVDNQTKRLEEIKGGLKESSARVTAAEDRLKELTADFDRFARLAVQKRWKLGDAFRKLPVVDAFASPTKIQQYTLNDLPIDYNFKYVTRYDRCTTCHLGIDRSAFTKDAIRSLTEEPSAEYKQKLADAKEMLKKRQEILKKQQNPLREKDLQLTRLTRNELTEARVNEYCVHPRLDLFVDGNSPHPTEKFGCTICHAGQGSATEFSLASHMPNGSHDKEDWEKNHGWESNHFWDYPMLPRRFLESACLKCHHQVADLLPEGNRVERHKNKEGSQKTDTPGAKVVRGYNLVRENGCFGCHEIAGIKGGRSVGPDLRLEPPLEGLTADGQPRGPIDPLSPPGTMRKVGPDLHRLSEKTNETWVWNWIRAPRNFRPNTKMPHFYGLINNSPEALQGTGQEQFPATEIHAITYYLFHESQDYIAHLLPQEKLPEPPASTKDVSLGRQLFTERGCLACHSHRGTAKKAENAGTPNAVLPIVGQADFGPNLSRLKAKLGTKPQDRPSARRWLVQWLLDPKHHHPRTFMPVMHLEPREAAAVADWLLSQEADWQPQEVPALDLQALRAMAQLYLEKSMTHQEAEQVLTSGGLSDDQVKAIREQRPDADELKLLPSTAADDTGKKQDWENSLKWYVGKKSISQLGCFGCHNIPGFENAKPIGTPLNDWGKKDPERLAFEDVIAYVDRHHQRVHRVGDEKDIQGLRVHLPIGELSDEAFDDPLKHHQGPYEEFFYESLKHHQREGFLHQKLCEPRSYDYDRRRSWEDRLRMPQFQFSRALKNSEESDEEYEARAAQEEAEAREAVMTFILGLVAEPVPLSYVYNAPAEHQAETAGRLVLDKYNCAGCHQLRSGRYDYRLRKGGPMIEELEGAYKSAVASNAYKADHRFEGHNAWTGVASRQADLLSAHALPTAEDEDALTMRLTQALRFTKKSTDIRNPDDPRELPAADYDIPAGQDISLPLSELLYRAEPQGGVFTELMVPYLVKLKRPKLDTPPNARSGLPPPLLREGEKTQPTWLFQFLRNPGKIRQLTILRMPLFNMSDAEAMALVNYFAAVDATSNPGVRLDHPYLAISERDDQFLSEKAAEYRQRLEEDKLTERTKEPDPYLADAYKLLTDKDLCLNCHQVGKLVHDRPIAPMLDLTRDRLRPDWLRRWIASPQRLLIYPDGLHPMPQSFEANNPRFKNLFDGLSARQLKEAQAHVQEAEARLKHLAELRKRFFQADAELRNARQAQGKDRDEDQIHQAEEAFTKVTAEVQQLAGEAKLPEIHKDTRKVLDAVSQKEQSDLEDARKEFGQFSLNQATSLRNILMNFNKVAAMQEEHASPPPMGGGAK